MRQGASESTTPAQIAPAVILSLATTFAIFAALTASPRQIPAAYVLATQQGRLVALPTPTAPSPFRLPWEGNGSTAAEIDQKSDGVLAVKLHLDLLGPLTPYFVDVRLDQDAKGNVLVWLGRMYGGSASTSERFAAASYAELCDRVTMTGDTIGALMARAADGFPPADVDMIAAREATDQSDIGGEVREALKAAASDDWRERERATAALRRADLLPQVRRARMTENLTAEQQRIVDVALMPPAAGPAVIDAVTQAARGSGKISEPAAK